MATFLVAHGGWSAGWGWKKMRPLLRARGHELFTPTYTGLGERVHLASPQVELETHIADILGVLQFEDLHNVVLIGHSYGGMVATGVADRAPERLAQLVYLDAFVPRDGQCLFDLLAFETRARMREAAHSVGDGWRVPPIPLPPDTSAEDVAWATPRRVMQPLIDRDRIELLAHRFAPTDDPDVVTAAKLVFEHGRGRKEPPPVLAERVHERAVVELGDQRRAQLRGVEPLVQPAAHRGVIAGQQARRTIE